MKNSEKLKAILQCHSVNMYLNDNREFEAVITNNETGVSFISSGKSMSVFVNTAHKDCNQAFKQYLKQ